MISKNTLGRTGIEVTELCFGTLILGPLQADLTPQEGAKAVRRALELGVNFIDTAKTYKTHEHTRLGIEGFRDTIIATKSPVKTAIEMREDVETCLRELGRDTIDIFHLHFVKSADDMREREGALDTLVKCREAGMIRAIGISSHGIQGTKCALDYNEIDVVFPIMNSKGLGILDSTRDELLAVIEEIHSNGRGLYSMKPLGGGHLIDDIPASIEYLRNLELFDSISAGLKTPEEAEVMVGVFEHDNSAFERALIMGKERANRKQLIIYEFMCEKCGACVEACGQGALSLGEKKAEVDADLCILCGYCAADCPKFAIRVI
ncbi:aldo/keto reductase [Candidatus Latescibacterota bacterium]